MRFNLSAQSTLLTPFLQESVSLDLIAHIFLIIISLNTLRTCFYAVPSDKAPNATCRSSCCISSIISLWLKKLPSFNFLYLTLLYDQSYPLNRVMSTPKECGYCIINFAFTYFIYFDNVMHKLDFYHYHLLSLLQTSLVLTKALLYW